MTGIYKITNKANGKIYIGQSVNIMTRWNQHFLNAFDYNLKTNQILYKAIRKYGITNFIFEIETLCEPEELNDLEIKYIQFYHSDKIGYNILPGGNQNTLSGEQNPNSKMKESYVFDIRESYKSIERKRDVYEKYKDIISYNTFNDIWRGKTWNHIHMDVYTDETKYKQRRNYDTVKSHKNIRVLSDEEVLDIRNRRNDGEDKLSVYETYSNINFNTFSDAWNGNTFKHIVSDHDIVKRKRHRIMDQAGSKNKMAKFNDEEIVSIRKRKLDGESQKNVYSDYNYVSKDCFRNIWNNRTYKDVKIDICNDYSKEVHRI